MSNLDTFTAAVAASQKAEALTEALRQSIRQMDRAGFLFCLHNHFQQPRISAFRPLFPDLAADFEICPATGAVSVIDKGEHADDIHAMQAIIEQWLVADPATNPEHYKDLHELLATCRYRMIIGGYDVPVANLPHIYASDAGNIMCIGEPFAATYYDTATHRVYSLRSDDNGMDVSAIAQRFGGGGHRHAAGFKTNLISVRSI